MTNKNKIILGIAIVVLATIVVLSIILIIRRAQQTAISSNEEGQIIPTPTTIQSKNSTSKPVLVTTFVYSPKNNDKDVSVMSQIFIRFPQSIINPSINNMELTLTPTASGSSQLLADKSTVVFTPATPLSANTKYSVHFKYNNSLLNWSFTTASAQNQTLNDEAMQTKADINYGEWQSNIQTQYPWFNKLPFQTDKYYIYFDLDQKKFIGTIYSPSEAESIKQQVYGLLKQIGVDVNAYQFDWTIKQ